MKVKNSNIQKFFMLLLDLIEGIVLSQRLNLFPAAHENPFRQKALRLLSQIASHWAIKLLRNPRFPFFISQLKIKIQQRNNKNILVKADKVGKSCKFSRMNGIKMF